MTKPLNNARLRTTSIKRRPKAVLKNGTGGQSHERGELNESDEQIPSTELLEVLDAEVLLPSATKKEEWTMLTFAFREVTLFPHLRGMRHTHENEDSLEQKLITHQLPSSRSNLRVWDLQAA